MEISEATVVNLLQGQARTEQLVKDLVGRFDKVVPALVQNDRDIEKSVKDIEKRVRSVEQKQWYFAGAGTVLGGLMTFLGEHYKIFGGK